MLGMLVHKNREYGVVLEATTVGHATSQYGIIWLHFGCKYIVWSQKGQEMVSEGLHMGEPPGPRSSSSLDINNTENGFI
jgi:hypothetical protein